MKINKIHFDVLVNVKYSPGWSGGTSPLKWVKSLNYNLGMQNYINFSQKPLSRADIFSLCENKMITDLEISLIIFAWGRMRRSNARFVLDSSTLWLPIVKDIRSGALTRKAAYKKFFDLRKANLIKGMGPAYYTKLIFFLMQKKENSGYIMDQWIARSINLLYEKEVINLIKTTGSLQVADNNDELVYENFCKLLEKIAKESNVKPDLMEEILFSGGGRKKGDWRKYVLLNT
jgi:hypothetical protein